MRKNPTKKQSCKEVRDKDYSELSQIVKKHPEVRQSLQNVAVHALHLKSPLTPKTSDKTLFFSNKPTPKSS